MDAGPARRDAEVVSLLHHRHLRDHPGAARGLPDGREPAHVLYEHACDLLLAARGLRAMAGADGTLPAVAATLGCLEATIDALADTLERMTPQAADLVLRAAEGAPSPEGADAARRLAEQCHAAARTLRVARDMTGGVRERVGPAVAGIVDG